jgi:uncharacterized membrane protein YuzA (DUF378 family)
MLINTSCSPVTSVASVLSSVGAINWGLISLLDFNLVTYLLGDLSTATKVVYALIGLSGLYTLSCVSRVFCGPSAKSVD